MTIGVEKLVELERKGGEIIPKGKAKNSKGKAVSHQDVQLMQQRSLHNNDNTNCVAFSLSSAFKQKQW